MKLNILYINTLLYYFYFNFFNLIFYKMYIYIFINNCKVLKIYNFFLLYIHELFINVILLLFKLCKFFKYYKIKNFLMLFFIKSFI